MGRGVCLNVGCIPTKAMLRSAEVFETMKHAQQFGVLAENVTLDYAAVVKRREGIVGGMRRNVEMLVKANGGQFIMGNATFAGKNQVTVQAADGSTQTLSARNLIIATGRRPAQLPIPGSDGKNVINSTQALQLEQPPTSVLVIGGGAVAASGPASSARSGPR